MINASLPLSFLLIHYSYVIFQIGITCYLAHIGSFVPCRFARIGILDAIYSTAGHHDSALKSYGESQKELATLNLILYQATNRSLVLCDEFGKSNILC